MQLQVLLPNRMLRILTKELLTIMVRKESCMSLYYQKFLSTIPNLVNFVLDKFTFYRINVLNFHDLKIKYINKVF